MGRKPDLPAKLKAKGWGLLNRPVMPSPAAVEAAVNRFRQPGELVWFEGHPGGNEGFSASLSFNTVLHSNDQGDFIQIALQAATLRFAPKDATGWDWSEHVRTMVKAGADIVGVKLAIGSNDKVTRGHKGTLQGSGEIGGKGLGVAAKASLGAAYERSRSSEIELSENQEISRTTFDRQVEITRSQKVFELHLKSPPSDDLVRFNADLVRAPILSSAEPSSVAADAVRVTIAFHLKGELQHAIRIRETGGTWRNLQETRNKQILSELMLSKFLKPMHAPMQLWPRKRK